MDFAVIALIFWGPVMVAWLLHERKKRLKVINESGWIESKGVRPAMFNVDVVYKNGRSKWKVSAKALNWDAYCNNPILKYRMYQKV